MGYHSKNKKIFLYRLFNMQEEKCIKYIIVVQQHQPDQLRYYEKEREKFFISSILLIRNSAFLNEKVRISHFFMMKEHVERRRSRYVIHFQCILKLLS